MEFAQTLKPDCAESSDATDSHFSICSSNVSIVIFLVLCVPILHPQPPHHHGGAEQRKGVGNSGIGHGFAFWDNHAIAAASAGLVGCENVLALSSVSQQNHASPPSARYSICNAIAYSGNSRKMSVAVWAKYDPPSIGSQWSSTVWPKNISDPSN